MCTFTQDQIDAVVRFLEETPEFCETFFRSIDPDAPVIEDDAIIVLEECDVDFCEDCGRLEVASVSTD